MLRRQNETTNVLPTFDIYKGNWSEYVEQLQCYFVERSVDKEHQVAVLLNSVGEKVYKLLLIKTNPKPLSSLSFIDIVNIMTEHMQYKSSVVFHRYNFRQRRQHLDESVEDYIKCLQTLAVPCKFSESDEEIREQLIVGMYSDIIRQILLSQTTIDYSKTVELAKHCETVLKESENQSGSGDPTATITIICEQKTEGNTNNTTAQSPQLSQNRFRVRNYTRILPKFRLKSRRRQSDRSISKSKWKRFMESSESGSNPENVESTVESPRCVYIGGQWIAQGVVERTAIVCPIRAPRRSAAWIDTSTSSLVSEDSTKESDDSASDDNELKLAGRFESLPDKVRTQPERQSPDDILYMILNSMTKPPPEIHSPITFKNAVLGKQPEYLETVDNLKQFKSVYDWHLMFLSSGKNSPDLRYFIGCGGKQVYQLEGIKWKNVVDLQVSMPARTLIYGEVVKEYRGEGNTQLYSKALHIIDALMLGGIDISNLSLTERLNQCALFCTALDKPFNTNFLPIRCKRLFNMESFQSAVNHLEYRSMKRIKRAVTFTITNRVSRQEVFHVLGSLLFIKEIKDPWESRLSKSSGHKYYFGIGKDNKPRSEYYIPEAARLDMISAFRSRVQWPWEPASAVLEGTPHSGLTRAQLEEYITANINR